MPGPTPKYTPAERAAQGNPGRRPDDVKQPGEGEEFFPEAPKYRPHPPTILTDNPTDLNNRAVEIWDGLAEYIHDARLLRLGDVASLARLCRYIAEWEQLTEILDVDGLTVNHKVRGLQRHPALLARNSLETQIESLEKQFGLTPEARLKITKNFADSLRNLPLAGKGRGEEAEKAGPVGFLTKKD